MINRRNQNYLCGPASLFAIALLATGCARSQVLYPVYSSQPGSRFTAPNSTGALNPNTILPYSSDYAAPSSVGTSIPNGIVLQPQQTIGYANGDQVIMQPSPSSPTLWQRLTELERRKNAWLRRAFIGD